MYYLIYRITHIDSGKEYIGVHQTKKLDDGYMGSGTLLKYAVNKYGNNAFRKEILFSFDNEEEMFAKEQDLVSEEYLATTNTYNLKIGGFGGWKNINLNPVNREKARKTTIEKYGEETIYEWQRKGISAMRDALKKKYGDKLVSPQFLAAKPSGMRGKKHSNETKQLMSSIRKGKGSGQSNSQFGIRFKWMNDGVINKRVQIKDINSKLNNGFSFGQLRKVYGEN